MPKVAYHVKLTQEQREKLLKIVRKGTSKAKRILHANILLALDENQGKPPSAPVIAERFNVHRQTVQTIRKAFATKGLEPALGRKPRTKPPIEAKITGDVEARIIALACSEPPEGNSRWTLRLLADQVVELEILESVSHMSISRVLKKTNLNLT